MKNRYLIISVTIVAILLLVGGTLGLYYLSRADTGCQHHSDTSTGQACYSMNLFNLIPVARLRCSFTSSATEGTTTMMMSLNPVGVARRFAENDRFEVSSTFDSLSHLPLSFALTQYDARGLRSTKTTTYDTDEGLLRWTGYSPPERNKKYKEMTVNLDTTVHSPLSASYHILESIRDLYPRGLQLDMQVAKYRYTIRTATDKLSDDAQLKDISGDVITFPFAVSSTRDHREEWRRRKEIKLRLYFSRRTERSVGRVHFPFKVALPLHIVTFKLVEPAPEV